MRLNTNKTSSIYIEERFPGKLKVVFVLTILAAYMINTILRYYIDYFCRTFYRIFKKSNIRLII